MLNINKMISPFNHYDYNNPKFIAIHYVGAQSSTAKNNATYFFNGDRQASAHYFVDNNSIWQSVLDSTGAWHIGNTRTEVNNQNSIGIEQCCMGDNLMVTEQTENNTIELVKYLMGKYNIPIENVRTHYTISGNSKICPNWNQDNWVRFNNFKNKIQNINIAPTTPAPQPVGTVYRVKLANGEQIGAYKNLDSAKSLAQINRCNVYSSNDNSLVASYLPSVNPVNKPIAYRVKRKNGEQLGAFGNLDNAKALAQKESAIVYDANGNTLVSYIPSTNMGYVNLSPNNVSWRVYSVDGGYSVGQEVAKLSPSIYGGLSYEILETKATNVYKIKTESFGLVAIYYDENITSSPIYGGSTPTLQPTPVTTSPVAPKPQQTSNQYAEKGIFTFNTVVTIRTAPEENSRTNVNYNVGEEVTYHSVILNKNNFNWIVYDRSNGTLGYLKIKDLSTGESYGTAR